MKRVSLLGAALLFAASAQAFAQQKDTRGKVTLPIPEGVPDPVPRSVALAATLTFVPCVKLDPLAGDVIETVGGVFVTTRLVVVVG